MGRERMWESSVGDVGLLTIKERGGCSKKGGTVEKGNLVQQRTDGAIGIVISVNGLEAEVMFGDGLREIVDTRMLEVVQFKSDAQIPACFVEMVDAYVRSRGFR